jgi:hypothetical protein
MTSLSAAAPPKHLRRIAYACNYTKSSLPIASAVGKVRAQFIRIPAALERGVPVQHVPKVKLM